MFSDVHWNGSISCYRSPTQPDTVNAKRSVFMKYVQQPSCRPTASIRSSHQNGSWANEGSVFGRVLELYVELHVACLRQISQQGVLQAKQLIHVQEANNKVNWEESKPAGSAACSAAMPPRSCAVFHLLRAPKLHISPPCVWFCYSHPGWHLQTSFFTLLLLLLPTFMCSFVGTLWVSSLNFSWSRNEKLSIFFFLPESLLILAKEQPREVSDDDSHRERADKPVWLCLWLYVHLILIQWRF